MTNEQIQAAVDDWSGSDNVPGDFTPAEWHAAEKRLGDLSLLCPHIDAQVIASRIGRAIEVEDIWAECGDIWADAIKARLS